MIGRWRKPYKTLIIMVHTLFAYRHLLGSPAIWILRTKVVIAVFGVNDLWYGHLNFRENYTYSIFIHQFKMMNTEKSHKSHHVSKSSVKMFVKYEDKIGYEVNLVPTPDWSLYPIDSFLKSFETKFGDNYWGAQLILFF